MEQRIVSPIKWDAEALSFLEGFNDPSAWFRGVWLPRYKEITQFIANKRADDQLPELVDPLWKEANNDISNAGQGVLKGETVVAMRDELVRITRDIERDGSPESFGSVVERFEGWKAEGRLARIPRLLIARAFAGMHPDRYHTTVDAESQNRALAWFVEHTGFTIPSSDSWAVRAQALTAHLDRSMLFDSDSLSRNIFPWFVVAQLRARKPSNAITPGHSPRPAEAVANLSSVQREIQLRHNEVQTTLFNQLVEEFGEKNVRTEAATGTGGFADAIAWHSDGRLNLYEIKIAKTAAEVVRQAMGQLLEYSFRAGGLEPVKLFAVGEPDLDSVTSCYLARLQTDFGLEIGYLQIKLPDSPDLPI